MMRRNSRLAALALAVVALPAGMAAPAADTVRHYVPAAAPAGNAPAPPFTNGVMVGSTFYVAGHIGLDPATGMTPATAEDETHRVMDAVKQTLAAAGLTLEDLVSVTVYCTDLKLYDAFNAVYRTYFPGQYPPRAFIGVNQLVRGAHFEINGIAVAPAAKRTKK
jgi:2-iminobutanoate/2-iminopropanoate deaminase